MTIMKPPSGNYGFLDETVPWCGGAGRPGLGLWRENDALSRMDGVRPGFFDFGEWRGPCVDLEGSVRDLLGECGQFGENFTGADRALPAADDLKASGAERGRGDQRCASGHGADFDPGERLAAIGAVSHDGGHRGGGGLAPEVVDHDVDIGGGLAESPGDRVGVPVERHGAGGTDAGRPPAGRRCARPR